MYTEEQIQVWKSKAEKWDELEQKISAFYGNENEDGDWEELDDDEGGDLYDIGEIAASAFGFL